MNRVLRKINRAALLTIILAMAFFISAASVRVYAGGDIELPNIQGVNADGTVKAGTTIKVSIDDLTVAMGSEFKTEYEKGKIKCYFDFYDTDAFGEPTHNIEAKYDGSYLWIKLDKAEYVGKYVNFATQSLNNENTGYNGNTVAYKIINTLHLQQGPEILDVKYKGNPVSKEVVVNVSSVPCRYYTDLDPTVKSEEKRTIKLYSSGNLVGTQTNTAFTGYNTIFSGVPVNYGANTSIKVEVHLTLDGFDVPPIYKTYTIPGQTLDTPSLQATKISSKQAALTWSDVSGATGYEIYKGSKKIATVGNVNKYTVKGKGTGKAKYKVTAIIKQGSTTYRGGGSAAAKPKKNEIRFNRGRNYQSTSYATCPIRITKVSLSGNTYTVTAYAVNHRIFKMKKYKNLRLGLYVGGKKAFSKKYKAKTVNCGPKRSKKLVFKIKGKKGIDLRNGGYVSYIEGGTPEWTF